MTGCRYLRRQCFARLTAARRQRADQRHATPSRAPTDQPPMRTVVSHSDSISERLRRLGLVLPPAVAPVANFVAVTLHGGTAHVSGQIPVRDGAFLNPGVLGREVTIEQGQAAARLAALNVLSQLSSALGARLERVERVLRLGVFVASTADFKDHPKVANGASDLIVQVFGERGAHARAAVGVASLPFGVSVEVDGIFAVGA